MRVLLSTYDSRGGVEPLLGLAVRLRELGAEVRMCAPCLAPVDGRDDCFAVGEVNQQALFAGAPQVVVPQWADQPYFASRVAELGIGAAHHASPPTTESLSAVLRTALAPATHARAAAVAGTIRTDGATRAATLLIDECSRERMP